MIASVDPGKKGYQCRIGMSTPGVLEPAFWPAPVREAEGGLEYDIVLMIEICRQWRKEGVLLVVLEVQAPQRRGRGSQGKEGSWSSWSNGFGFGCWKTALTAAGFFETNETVARSSLRTDATQPCFVLVDPLVWKRRMAAVVSHSGEDTRGARKKANDQKTVEVAKRIDPSIDLRPVERGGGTKRSDSPDKAASFLLATYGQRWILRLEGSIQ